MPLDPANSQAATVEIRNVSRVYGKYDRAVVALKDVSFEIHSGEFVSVVGPSGCGKSTLLRIIAGLAVPTRGSVTINEESVTGPRGDVGLMFQTPTLFPWRNVERNIMLPLEILGLKPRNYRERVRELLKFVDLAGLESRRPSELSGGMQQRVALCRLLVCDPSVMLLDEPFGALDEFTRERLNVDVAAIIEHEARTALLVTHNIAEAVFLADRVVVMGAHPGRVLGIVPVDLPRPRTREMMASPEHGEYVRAVRRIIGIGS